MKNLAVIFCGENEHAGRGVASLIRNDEWNANVISAYMFNGNEWNAQRIIIMPDVPRWHLERLAATYPNAEYIDKPKEKKPDASVVVPLTAPKKRGRPRKTAIGE